MTDEKEPKYGYASYGNITVGLETEEEYMSAKLLGYRVEGPIEREAERRAAWTDTIPDYRFEACAEAAMKKYSPLYERLAGVTSGTDEFWDRTELEEGR